MTSNTLNTLPLLMDGKRVKAELGIGNNSLYALEEQGLLTPVRLGSLRIRRYKTQEVLALAGADFQAVRMPNPPEPSDAVEPDTTDTEGRRCLRLARKRRRPRGAVT